MPIWADIAFIIGAVVALIFLAIGLVVAYKIATDKIDVSWLISEPDNGKASISRFQFLVFTFIIAGLFLMLSIESGAFVEIPQSVLYLLGISGTGYVASKTITAGVQKSAIAAGRPAVAPLSAARPVNPPPPVPPPSSQV
jgi:uncharacterized membrane protein